MWISRYVGLFIIYSFMGWIYETTFCTVTEGKWENRGFLYGPVCPIYGVGALAITAVMSLTHENEIELSMLQIFIVSVIGSAILEYTTSWVLEKLFHAVWWDYSNLPLNVHGRISLFTSLGFGLAGLLIVYKIEPFTIGVVDQIPAIMMELLALCFTFIFASDLTLTVTVLHHFDKTVAHMEEKFNQHMEAVVDTAVQQSNKIKESMLNNKHVVEEKIYSLGSFTKGAVRRISSFRGEDHQREAARKTLISLKRNTKKGEKP